MSERTSLNRRAFLTNSMAVAGGAAIVSVPLKSLLAKETDGQGNPSRGWRGCSPDYGPLAP